MRSVTTFWHHFPFHTNFHFFEETWFSLCMWLTQVSIWLNCNLCCCRSLFFYMTHILHAFQLSAHIVCAHTEEPHVNWRTTLQLTASILAPIFKGLHVGGFDWLWKETKHSDVVIFQSPWNVSWKLLRTLLSNWSDLLGMMGSAVWVKSKWGMFYGFGMMFLNSDLFVAVPPTGGEQPYKLDFFTHLSDGRALIHCSDRTHNHAQKKYVTWRCVQNGLYEL